MPTTPKYALITGCSRGGIGHALAEELLSRGFHVIATARQLDSMEDLAQRGATTMALDVTSIDAIRKVRDAVASMTDGKLDILVNNAGQGPLVPVTDMPMSDVRAVFEVNLFGPISMVQEFVHLLIASGDARILQISSVGGVMPLPFCAVYNASKAALSSFGNTLRLELAPFNIKVVSVMTGSVKTNIVKPHTLPENSMYKPMEDFYQEKRVKPIMMDAMPVEQYARTVVAEVVKPKPRAWLWVGTHTWFCWIVDTFIGQRGFDWIFTKKFGLSEYSVMIKSGQVKVA